MKQRLLLFLLIISIILSNGMYVFSAETEISGLYVSPRAVTIIFSQEPSLVEVKMDGKVLNEISSDSDKTKFVFLTYEELLYDNWYGLEISVNGQNIYNKAIKLKTLLYDNFELDANRWKYLKTDNAIYDADNKTMNIPKAINDSNYSKHYYGEYNKFDANQLAWSNYRIDIKLDNEVNSAYFRLYVEALKQTTDENKGVAFGVSAYSAYKENDIRIHDWFEQIYQKSTQRAKYASDDTGMDNLMYAIAGGDSSKEIDNATEYLHYMGRGNTYRQSKDDVISFDVSQNSQAILLNDEIHKVTSIDAQNETGGFTIHNWSTVAEDAENPLRIKEISVYKLEEEEIVANAELSSIYIGRDSISVKFPSVTTGVSVTVDGAELTNSEDSFDKDFIFDTGRLSFDKWYTVKAYHNGTEIYAKRVKLNKLYADDFTNGTAYDDWSWENAVANDNGYLTVGDTRTFPSTGSGFPAEHAAWKDYRVDLKLANPVTDRISLIVDTYRPDKDTKVVQFGFPAYRDVYFNAITKNYNTTTYNNKMYGYLFDATSLLDDESQYLGYVGQDLLTDGKTLSVITSQNSQVALIGDTVHKEKSIALDSEAGGITLSKVTAGTPDILVDEMAVYNIEEDEVPAPATGVEKIYASKTGVTVELNGCGEDAVATLDGINLTTKIKSSDGKEIVFNVPEGGINYDEWHALEITVAGQIIYNKAISLSTLLYDNFEENADGFSALYDSETKSMFLPRAINDYRIYKYSHGNDGFWNTNWKDYRIDIKLANDIDSSKFRLHVDAYLQSKTGTTGVGFGIGAYTAYNRYDWFEQIYQKSAQRAKYTDDGTGYDNLMYEIAGGDSSKELDNDTEYLHYIGLNESYRQSKDDVISFNVSKDSQAIMLNDEIHKETHINAENEYGGFMIYNWSTAGTVDEENPALSENPAKIKEIVVYKLLEMNMQDVYHTENLLIINDGENFNLTYNIVAPDGQSNIGADIKWYSCDMYGDVFTEIDGQTSAVLSAAGLENKIIRAIVTLKDVSSGITLNNSTIYIPEAPPVARDVKITGKALSGEILKAEYTYFDINKDIEDTSSTKIIWYASERISDGYEEIGRGETFKVNNTKWGKYIKVGVIPYAMEDPCEGTEVFSEPILIDLISKMYVSPRNIILNFQEPVNNIVVRVDGKVLDLAGINADRTSYEYNLSGLTFDKWYKLTVTSDETTLYSKKIRLKQLLQDDFESDAVGWINGIYDENGYLIIPKDENTATPPMVYFGDEEGFSEGQSSWQDYRIDIKLANSVNDKFRFYVEAYKPDIGVNEGFGISLRYFKNQERYNWFEMMYKTEVRPDLPYDIFLEEETEIDDSVAYLHKYGQISHLAESNILSFCVSEDFQTLMIGDKIKKTMKIPGGTQEGGFVMFNRANDFGEDVKIDEISVYKVQEEADTDIVISGTASRTDDAISVSYNVTNIDSVLVDAVQVIIAAYENNKLAGVKLADAADISTNGEITVSGNVIFNVKSADLVKIFVWENVGDEWEPRPLFTDAFEIRVN